MLDKKIINLVPEAKKYVLGTIVYQTIMLVINILMLAYFSKGLRLFLDNKILVNTFIYYITIAVLCVVISRAFFTYRSSIASFKASKKVKLLLRNRILEHMFNRQGELDSIKESELMQLSTEGVEQIEAYMSKYVPQFFYSLLAPITLFVVLATVDLKSALVLLLSVPIIPILIIIARKKSVKVFEKYWNKYTDVGESFLECLYGLTTLKINRADAAMQSTLEKKSENFRIATMNVLGMQLHSITIMDLVAYGASSVGMLMAILALKSGSIDIASAVFIMLLASEFFLPLRLLGSYFHLASNGMSAAKRIFEFLSTDIVKESITKVESNESYVVHNLNYSYGEKKVLYDISMKLPKTGLVSIVGSSGSGKSTLAKIMSKRLDSSNIQLFGCNLEKLSSREVKSKVCYVPSNAKIFGKSVKSAVLERKEALELVELKLPYELELKDNCSNISGGQKQRLALGRALASNFDIYILDEATSNVDKETEEIILDKIKKLSKTKLIILISHRMKLTTYCDSIFVLEDGRLISEGSFEKVYEHPTFKNLYDSQEKLEGGRV